MIIKIKLFIIGMMRRLGIWKLYLSLCDVIADFQVALCRRRYAKHIERLRSKPKGEKIRVLFIVSEIAKWKEQKLYEEMERSGVIEPIVGLSAWNMQNEYNCSNEELVRTHQRAEEFFDRLGVRHIRTVKVENGKRVFTDLSDYSPDIVFYTEPWGPCKKQDPWSVSKYAITLYVPYFTPNYGKLEWDCHLIFHRQLYGYFCLNEAWGKVYEESLNKRPHSVRFIPVGHPGLDFFSKAADSSDTAGYVIYAPHFSIPDPKKGDQEERYSTFDWNHREILEYAKRHPELKWVFKPHPLLRKAVVRTGLMSEEEVAEYYAEWARIGIICEDGNYQELFIRSRAMITDCGSFLTEYGATGKPVIHLICADNRITPIFLMRDLYDAYYQVHDLCEMKAVFKNVLEDGNDPMRDRRCKEASRAGIVNSNASSEIVKFIKDIAGRNSENA